MKTNSKNYTEILEEICTTTIAAEAEEIDRNGIFPKKSINEPEIVDWIREINPDVIFCFGWSQLIKKGYVA